MSKRKVKTMAASQPRVVGGHVVSRRLAARAYQGGQALAQAAARVAVGKCPLCGVRPGATQVAMGPVFVKVCEPCSRPVWHVMGLLEWFGGRRNGR